MNCKFIKTIIQKTDCHHQNWHVLELNLRQTKMAFLLKEDQCVVDREWAGQHIQFRTQSIKS